MNIKLALILILLFLILLVLFYNINLESNIIILLAIIIILLINDLIKRSEHFQSSVPENMFVSSGNNIESLQNAQMAELNALYHLVQTLNRNKQNDIVEQNMNLNYPSIIVRNSCIRQATSQDSPSVAQNTSNAPSASNINSALVASSIANSIDDISGSGSSNTSQ